LLVLCTASFLGFLADLAAGVTLNVPVLLDTAIALWLGTGVLLAVGVARWHWLPRVWTRAERLLGKGSYAAQGQMERADPATAPEPARPSLRMIAAAIGGTGLFGIALFAPAAWSSSLLTLPHAVIAAVLCLGGAWLSGIAASYLAQVDQAHFPEAAALSRAARVLCWIFVLAVMAVGFSWAGWELSARVIHVLLLILCGAACLQLLLARPALEQGHHRFPVNLGVFTLFGSRLNPFASALDALQRQFGIDLRSTWALTVVRASIEPIVVGLGALAWLSTSATVVRVDEAGFVERLGVPLDGPNLQPGIHLHWPWPIERVVRLPVQRIETVAVGHEGEKESGPENVLWARLHGTKEYTLLLGNGRDLIALDGSLQFRIIDPRAWRYQCQNPREALRSIAYRAVMKSTVGRTLAETLSENVTILTAEMQRMVQSEADALDLGVQVVAFTMGGMHPPVAVAEDYQAVASAELGKKTVAIEAQAYRNEVVPQSQADVVASENTARADAAIALGRASGEACAFRALQSAWQGAPEEFKFRRRLETMESALSKRRFLVLDARIQRDGGELWLRK
jgi:membrane protease subunit HflK